MVKQNELIKFIYKTIGKDLLAKAWLIDEVANGVQILGKEKVAKVVLGVSCNEEFLKEAVKRKADFCIFHHGLDSRTTKSKLPVFLQKRLKIIFENNLTIAGFHYCLDAHHLIGNNAVIVRKLGAKRTGDLFETWGCAARFSRPQSVKEIKEKCEKLFGHKVLAFLSGPQKVKTIGVVSGAGKPAANHILEMQEKGIELYISGETSESIPHIMKETKINYFLGGHYNTEVFGVQELGKKIKSRFGNKIKVEFIDIPSII